MRHVKRSRVSPGKPLLTAILDPAALTSRSEAKEIEFKPGQATGLHLHPCPVTSYIAMGSVFFQVQGEPVRRGKPVTLSSSYKNSALRQCFGYRADDVYCVLLAWQRPRRTDSGVIAAS